MDYRALFKGEYISAVELGDKQPTLTIVDVKGLMLDEEDGKQKGKGLVVFKETDRGWVLNKTNAQCLAAMFGKDTNGWKGKRVTLCMKMVQVGRETEPGIRVKGSPDITAPVEAVIKLPRRKPKKEVLVPTAKEAA
jgi:hypothetical protein